MLVHDDYNVPVLKVLKHWKVRCMSKEDVALLTLTEFQIGMW